MAKLSRKVGATSQIFQVFIQSTAVSDGSGLTGLVFNTGSLTAYYHRDTATTATAITLVTMTAGTFTSSGFVVVDGTNMPGLYQLCVPDAAFATGAKSVVAMLKGATNMAPVVLEIDLDAQADVTHWNGTAVSSPATAGIPDVNVKNINNVAATSVTAVGANVGTTQPVNFTGTAGSALVKGDAIDWNSVAVTGMPMPTYTQPTNFLATLFGASVGTSTLTQTQVSGYAGPILTDNSTGLVTANATKINGVTPTMGASLTLPTSVASPTNLTAGTLTTVTTATNLTTNNDKTGYALSSLAIQAIWDAATSALSTAGSIGKRLVDFVTTLVYTAPPPAAPTASQVATAVWQDTTASDFTTTGSIGKSLFTSGNVPGANGGLFIAGTNAATAITGSLTTTFTGNLMGAVGSVTAAITLPTIPTNWITADGIAIDAIGSAELAASAVTKIQSGLAGATDQTAIKAKTDQLDFGGGHGVQANTLALGSDAFAVTSLASFSRAMLAGSTSVLAVGTTTTAKIANPGDYADDYYNGVLIGFWSGSANPYLARQITDFVGATGVATFGAFPNAVGSGDVATLMPWAVTGFANPGDIPTPPQIATAIWQDTINGDFTVDGSIGKSLFTAGNVPGSAEGLFIAGNNSDVTVDITGNVTGSIGSIAADGISADSLSLAAANKLTDILARRSMALIAASANGEAVNGRNLLREMRQQVNKISTVTTPGLLTVYAEDDSTVAYTKTLTADATAQPVTAADPT